eukprot:GHVS01023023.1.p1 GENE.GHVS01023023.1~~GHVS01023023.1.p1  ORF type:complete len:498 (+),score=33.36 GHVS01023023.1:713-2206(+)
MFCGMMCVWRRCVLRMRCVFGLRCVLRMRCVVGLRCVLRMRCVFGLRCVLRSAAAAAPMQLMAATTERPPAVAALLSTNSSQDLQKQDGMGRSTRRLGKAKTLSDEVRGSTAITRFIECGAARGKDKQNETEHPLTTMQLSILSPNLTRLATYHGQQFVFGELSSNYAVFSRPTNSPSKAWVLVETIKIKWPAGIAAPEKLSEFTVEAIGATVTLRDGANTCLVSGVDLAPEGIFIQGLMSFYRDLQGHNGWILNYQTEEGHTISLIYLFNDSFPQIDMKHIDFGNPMSQASVLFGLGELQNEGTAVFCPGPRGFGYISPKNITGVKMSILDESTLVVILDKLSYRFIQFGLPKFVVGQLLTTWDSVGNESDLQCVIDAKIPNEDLFALRHHSHFIRYMTGMCHRHKQSILVVAVCSDKGKQVGVCKAKSSPVLTDGYVLMTMAIWALTGLMKGIVHSFQHVHYFLSADSEENGWNKTFPTNNETSYKWSYVVHIGD